MLKHYQNGEQIQTNEPCLNCTCVNSMLMCYLRVCPFIRPVDENCLVEKVPGECCPRVTCPETDIDPESDPEPTSTTKLLDLTTPLPRTPIDRLLTKSTTMLTSTTTTRIPETTTSQLPRTSLDKMLSRSESPVDGRQDEINLPHDGKSTPSGLSTSTTSSVRSSSPKGEKKDPTPTQYTMMDITSTSHPTSILPTTSRRPMNGNEPSQPRKEIGPFSPMESFTEGYLPTRVTWKKTEPNKRPAPTPGVIPGEGKSIISLNISLRFLTISLSLNLVDL